MKISRPERLSPQNTCTVLLIGISASLAHIHALSLANRSFFAATKKSNYFQFSLPCSGVDRKAGNMHDEISNDSNNENQTAEMHHWANTIKSTAEREWEAPVHTPELYRVNCKKLQESISCVMRCTFQHSSLSRYAEFQFGRFGVMRVNLWRKNSGCTKRESQGFVCKFDAWHSFWHIKPVIFLCDV